MAALDRDRLAKVLRLLSSSVDGEALAAARRASLIVTAAGLDWLQVLEPATVTRIAYVKEPYVTPDTIGALSALRRVAESGLELKAREAEFIESLTNQIKRYRTPPSERQAAWLDAIDARAKRAAEAAA